ncbi:MAG: NAD(P)-dependent oxidoreductase [SAR324 cluster bacterium]|nr:NAD(P)-dependent oxidoreductase [SAR324 cluster bacterium]MCZ6645577.1 NAD(P)-dependent oxidoreductase [SAR324 cluster bacterium]
MKIGFIGLGRMGYPMARNLAGAGHELLVFDSHSMAMESLREEAGVTPMAGVGEVAAQTQIVFTVLPNNDIVREVYLGAEGIAAGAREGTVTCDCSTVGPEVSEEISAALHPKGVTHFDTPMLGSQPQAVDGEIFFIVAGDAAQLGKAAPLLEVMGKMHMHVGPSGTANRIKLIHNALGAVNSVAVAESLALCARLEVDPEIFYQVVSNGGGMAYSTYFGKRAQRVSAGQFDPTFTLELMLKDVGLALQLAEQAHVPVPIMEETRQTYQEGADNGWGQDDFSAVSRVIEKRMGKKLFGK